MRVAFSARIPRSALLLAVLASLGSTACPGTLAYPAEAYQDSGDAGPVDDAAASACPDVPTMFAQTCGLSGCHDSMTKSQGLDLQSAGVAVRLVGVPSTGGAGFLIDRTTPAKSVVYTKLLQPPPFGGRMPLAGTALDDATTQCVLDWVSSEASTGMEADM